MALLEHTKVSSTDHPRPLLRLSVFLRLDISEPTLNQVPSNVSEISNITTHVTVWVCVLPYSQEMLFPQIL